MGQGKRVGIARYFVKAIIWAFGLVFFVYYFLPYSAQVEQTYNITLFSFEASVGLALIYFLVLLFFAWAIPRGIKG